MNPFSSILKSYMIYLCALAALGLASGCGLVDAVDKEFNPQLAKKDSAMSDAKAASAYYNDFFVTVTKKQALRKGTSNILALDSLPKDGTGNVNWTAAVVGGYINPRATIEDTDKEDRVFDMNVFIEAKVPLMANVLFPHSIHTYWLSCKNCHPDIFLPEAGSNPITMAEIFKGEWCGRCHGKVAFTFWPRGNCTRCHSVLKGKSLEKENFR